MQFLSVDIHTPGVRPCKYIPPLLLFIPVAFLSRQCPEFVATSCKWKDRVVVSGGERGCVLLEFPRRDEILFLATDRNSSRGNLQDVVCLSLLSCSSLSQIPIDYNWPVLVLFRSLVSFCVGRSNFERFSLARLLFISMNTVQSNW